MSWKQLLAQRKVQPHTTSKQELVAGEFYPGVFKDEG
jgi:hypothetical protein